MKRLTIFAWLLCLWMAAIAQAATVTSKGAQGAVNFGTAGVWVGDAKPQPTDTAVVADGDAITLDEDFTGNLQAAGNTGYYALASGTRAITGNVTYGGTSTSGLVRVSGGTLTINGTVTNSGAGYAVAMTSTGALTVNKIGGTALTGSGGRALDVFGSGAIAVNGTVTNTGASWTLYHRGTSTVTITGAVVGGSTDFAPAYQSGGTLNIVGSISYTSRALYGAVYLTGGACNWVGDAALAAGSDGMIVMTNGTLNLANDTLGDYLRLQCGGRFVVSAVSGSTINQSSAARSGRLIETDPNAQIAVLGKAIKVEKWPYPKRN